jgi:hypothetical protein
MGHASHFPEFYGPQTPEEYAAQQHQDDVEAYVFQRPQQTPDKVLCTICQGIVTLDGLRACLRQPCQCGSRAGMHAVLHPHRYLASGCVAFHPQKGLPYAFD